MAHVILKIENSILTQWHLRVYCDALGHRLKPNTTKPVSNRNGSPEPYVIPFLLPTMIIRSS